MNHGGVCRTAPATPGLLKIAMFFLDFVREITLKKILIDFDYCLDLCKIVKLIYSVDLSCFLNQFMQKQAIGRH